MARKLPIPNGRLDGALDANGMRIVNLADPMSDDDAATKGYVRKHAVKSGVSSIEGKSGDLTLDQIGAQKKLTPGTNVEITEDGVVNVTCGNIVESEVNPGYAARADYASRSTSAEHCERADSSYNSENASRAATADFASSADYAQHAGYATAAGIAEHVPWDGVEGKPDVAAVELSGEYEDGTAFSFSFLTAGA